MLQNIFRATFLLGTNIFTSDCNFYCYIIQGQSGTVHRARGYRATYNNVVQGPNILSAALRIDHKGN